MKKKVFTKQWFKAMGIRAIRTFAQGLLSAGIVEGVAIHTFDWVQILSVGATAALISVIMSFAGLPEVSSEEEE